MSIKLVKANLKQLFNINIMNKQIDNKVIVIGGDHHNTLWVIRSLGLGGISSFAIVINPNKKRSFVAKSRYLKQSWVIDNEIGIKEILLNNFSSENLPPVIICASDGSANYIDEHYDELKSQFLMSNIKGEGKLISYWMNKFIMNKAAKDAGFNVPKTWEIDMNSTNMSHYLVPTEIIYPCIIKPQKSCMGTKYDFEICYNQKQLLNYIKNVRQHSSCILIQEYLKPDYETAIIGVRLPNSKKNILSGVLLKIGTCTSKHNMGMPTYECVVPELEPWIDKAAIECFFQKIDYYGIYSIEFFISNGKTYFLEINLRTDGDMFVYTMGKVNLPLLWVTDVTGNNISTLQQKIKRITYGMLEIPYVKYLKFKNIIQGIKELIRSDCFATYNTKDIKPFIYKFFYFFQLSK